MVSGEGIVMEKKFMSTAAEIFETEVSELSMDIEYKNWGKWDSLHMMNLVMELEEVFDISIPLEKLANVKKLSDMYALVQGRDGL